MTTMNTIRRSQVDVRAPMGATLLTLAAGAALLLWGVISGQAFVVMLGVSIAIVTLMGWVLERASAKQHTRGMR